jgi:hypothetical protein
MIKNLIIAFVICLAINTESICQKTTVDLYVYPGNFRTDSTTTDTFFISDACSTIIIGYDEYKNPNCIYWNYLTNQINYREHLTDMAATVLIPQNIVAMETYKWYRLKKKYSISKSIRYTIKYYKLNIKKQP